MLVEPAAEAGAAFPIDDEITLGRGGGCTVPLAFDTFVSQVHARAFDRDGTLWIEDLGSRNGTFVNGEQVHEPTQGHEGRARAGRRDRARGRPMRLATGSATDTGLVRGNNEDSFLVDGAHQLFAVADGMGGHRGGEVASRTAIEALRAAIAAGQPVHDAIVQANTAVIERAAGDDELTGMGTTLTAVVVAGGRQLLIGHVGDSRAYLLHDGTLRRITDDHSLVEELVREAGSLPSRPSRTRNARSSRALGVDPDVEVDLYTVEVTAGDRVLICSDGLTTMVRERDVERLARSEPDPQRAAEVLVDAANRAGGEDNTSVVVVDVLEVDAAAPPTRRPRAARGARRPPAFRGDARRHPSAAARRRPRASATRGGVASAACCCCSCRWCSCSGSRSAASAGTRAARTTSASRPIASSSTRACPAACSAGIPTIEQRTPLTAGQLTQIDHDRVARRRARFALRRRSTSSHDHQARRRRDVHHHDHHDHHRTADTKPGAATTTKPSHDEDPPRPHDDTPRLTMALAPIARQRRRAELSLGLLVVIIAVGGYILVALADGPKLPPGLYALLAWVFGLYLVAHFAIRRFAPYADATLLPLAALLNGIGFVTIARLDHRPRGCNRCGSRSASPCSWSRSSSCATCACSSGTATRSRRSVSARC